MKFPKVVFEIIEENKCPFYEVGDKFRISGKTLLVENPYGNSKKLVCNAVVKTPFGKSVCRILSGDLTSVLVSNGNTGNIPEQVMNCSGCTGSILLAYKREKKKTAIQAVRGPKQEIRQTEEFAAGEDAEEITEKDIGVASKLLSQFPIFQSLDEADIKKLIPMLKLKKFPKGATLLKKGDPGTNLYIILSGKAEVLMDDGITLRVMERGEVFGEISLLIGTPVGATIRVGEVVTVLMIYGKDFKKVLRMFPTLQMYFARLLAERLAKTNVERDEEFSSGMIGSLADNPPAELFQSLNLNHKTGVLNLTLSRGPANLFFNEGSLVDATYGSHKGKEAFFEVMKENEGRFKFLPGLEEKYRDKEELGDFMWLLMEGSRRIDEDEI